MWDSMGKVEDSIKKWKPKKCKTEKDYENSLLRSLQKKMPKVKLHSNMVQRLKKLILSLMKILL